MSEDELTSAPLDADEKAEDENINSLPETSRDRYETAYNKFMEWRATQNLQSFSENVFLIYFEEISQKYKSSTLLSLYSMLRSTVNINHNIDVSKYRKLQAFLKRTSENYVPKKSKILTPDDFNTFLNQAPDQTYLLMKAVVVIGLAGACRREELCQLTVDDMEDLNSSMLVKLKKVKNKQARFFRLTGRFYDICKKYVLLRPPHLTEKRFFLKYINGKCTRQVVGINRIGSMAKDVAKYLKLPNPELYTGHCFRRSSATLLVNAGGDLLTLKGDDIMSERLSLPKIQESSSNSGQNEIEVQVKSEPQEPQFESIYVEDSDEHSDIKKEVDDDEETFEILSTEKIMQAIDYDNNEDSIEQQISLMEENVFIKSEDILENSVIVDSNTNQFGVNIKNEEMDIKDEEDIVNEDRLNQRLPNFSIPVVGVGFIEANSSNLPKCGIFTIMDYFNKNNNFINSEIMRLTSETSGKQNYGDNVVGYVQVKHEPSLCKIKASITPEYDTNASNYDVSCIINTAANIVIETKCHKCPARKGGCVHCVAFLMWLHRRSEDPSPGEEVTSYWKKPLSKTNHTRHYVTTDDFGKRKVVGDGSVLQQYVQVCKRRKIENNIMRYYSIPKFFSLSIHCLAMNFNKTALTKNGENFQKFCQLHIDPELILNVEEATRDQSQNSLRQEMRYGRVSSSKAYAVTKCKTVDEGLKEIILGANIVDSSAISQKLKVKNKALQMLADKTSMEFFKIGISLSVEHPFIEASPDAINATFVVEIKTSVTEKTLHKYLDSGGNIKPEFIYQMQLQMHLTKKEKAIFVIVFDFESSKNLIINYCDYDKDLTTRILNGINDFWIKNIFNKVI